MDRRLALALGVTDVMFIAYWAVAALACAGVVHLPASWMYAGYDQPRVIAWNGSFFPVDLAFSLTGLATVRAARRGHPSWRPLALISRVLTMVAGLMVVSYWSLLGEYDPSWFLPNLAFVVWPLAFLPRLVRELTGSR